MKPEPAAPRVEPPMYEVYEEDDVILPSLTLLNPCGIRVELTDDAVRLFIGPRDWAWSRKTGILSGCGTEIDPPAIDGGKR